MFQATMKIAEQVSAAEELKILADLTSLCPLVVARLPLISVSDIAELTSAATGMILRFSGVNAGGPEDDPD